MTKRLMAIAALAAAVWAPPALAQSQCATFETIGNGAKTTYDPFSPSPTLEFFDIKIRRANVGVRGVRFILADTTPRGGGPGVGPLGPLRYDVTWPENTARTAFVVGNAQPMALLSPEVRLQGQGNNAVEVTRFLWTVAPGQQASAQQHRESLTVRYQCLDSQGAALGPFQEQTFGVDLILNVDRFAAAYIGSIGNTRGAISFGPIGASTANLSRAIGITALSTLPYQIEVETENGQKLKRQQSATDGIDYTMRYGGVTIADGDKVTCPITAAPTGTINQFEVTLDRASVARQAVGTYADTVTLTFTPRDTYAVTSCVVDR